MYQRRSSQLNTTLNSPHNNPLNNPTGFILLPETAAYNNNTLQTFVLNNTTNTISTNQADFNKNCNIEKYNFINLPNDDPADNTTLQTSMHPIQEVNNLNETKFLSQQDQLQLLLAQQQQQHVLLEQQQQKSLMEQHLLLKQKEQHLIIEQQQQNVSLQQQQQGQQQQQHLLLEQQQHHPQQQHLNQQQNLHQQQQQQKYELPDLLRRKLIQQQLILLLHANKCQKRDMLGDSKCLISHCQTMKNVLKHIVLCHQGRECNGKFNSI